jgi:hypothetical protein
MGPEEAFRELEAVYADLERELAERRPRCELSSRCCRFREYGHQLWTSVLELDYLRARSGPPPEGASAEGVCPYLKEGRCGAREGRMLGCRIFFCDPGYKEAMGPLYEAYHRRVKEIHVRHGIPYRYGEFLSEMRG